MDFFEAAQKILGPDTHDIWLHWMESLLQPYSRVPQVPSRCRLRQEGGELGAKGSGCVTQVNVALLLQVRACVGPQQQTRSVEMGNI